MKLIIQIPAYNEESTIGATLRELPRTLPGFSVVEVLVIDDGSRDRTAVVAKQNGADHVLRLLSHRGLSAAFLAGLDAGLRLGADVIVNTDADNQYVAADIGALVKPIVDGTAEVVIGDRQVGTSPWMSPLKRLLQRLGSRAVGVVSGLDVKDATSGMRAFSREAAYQLNVFNPFTYTLETIIQSGYRNLKLVSVPVRTNAPTRPSRLYRGMGSYLRKSVVTMFRVYTLYKPLKTFVLLGSLLALGGIALGVRFLVFYLSGSGGGHLQSLILAAILLIVGFQAALIGLLADLISVNRRLGEEVLLRVRRLERTREQGERGADLESIEAEKRDRDWVWLVDEQEVEERLEQTRAEAATLTPAARKRRRRKQRRDGEVRHAEPLPHHPKPHDAE